MMAALSAHRSFTRPRLTVIALVLALTVVFGVPGSTSGAACTDKTGHAAEAEPASRAGDELSPRTGIDLEVRILNLRIEFPWMRRLPISPGRQIVISLLARHGDDPGR